ncbi:50S ribosomal protein L15 [Candidatus Magnetaquicoccus inordinatus]|uniref:50S ribosomal protein L15 n=1 Tax=Candidatus Magnetaquicoccus inordinatus TaxID=2496818 RepID=UPI00102B04FC|nr:50S ribosomal protein L15 [Candidatus Magnetaquicoccus inordinatus]
MKLNQLPECPTGRIAAKRKGQGIGSGNGKTAGKGTKGQTARSGGYHKVGFEGGQMPLQRRLPKRGFRSPFKEYYALVQIEDLDIFEAGSEIALADLQAKGLVGRLKDGVKLLGDGEINKALTIHVDKVSRAAQEKVEAAGGKVVLSGASA